MQPRQRLVRGLEHTDVEQLCRALIPTTAPADAAPAASSSVASAAPSPAGKLPVVVWSAELHQLAVLWMRLVHIAPPATPPAVAITLAPASTVAATTLTCARSTLSVASTVTVTTVSASSATSAADGCGQSRTEGSTEGSHKSSRHFRDGFGTWLFRDERVQRAVTHPRRRQPAYSP